MLLQKKRSALKYISPITEQIEVALIIEECKCFPRFNQLCIKTNRKWKWFKSMILLPRMTNKERRSTFLMLWLCPLTFNSVSEKVFFFLGLEVLFLKECKCKLFGLSLEWISIINIWMQQRHFT